MANSMKAQTDSDVATSTELDSVHHVAVTVDDISKAVDWYQSMFRCQIGYQDATWALLEFQNTKIALVVADQHPPHVGFVTPRAADFGELRPHRDGTKSTYVRDPAGNAVELMADDHNEN